MKQILLLLASIVSLEAIPSRLYKRDTLCGPSNGQKCPDGLCCSDSGYATHVKKYYNNSFCGSTFPFCAIGCNPDYGKCWTGMEAGVSSNSDSNNTFVPASPGGLRCGINYEGELCPGILCCSKNGFCGRGDSFCTDGCQFQYGTCDRTSDNSGGAVGNRTTGNGGGAASDVIFCGGMFGKCPKGMCCNADGTCGTSDSDCDIQRGCNSGYGSCLPMDYQCGPAFGNQKCGVKGWCCSSVGYCGTGPEYCSVERGCQSECSERDNSTSSTETQTTATSSTSTSSFPSSSSSSTSETRATTTQSESTFISFTSSSTSTFTSQTTSSSTSSSTAPVQTALPGGSCGPTVDNPRCPEGSCCSIWGYCGISSEYCSPENCLYQCDDGSEGATEAAVSTTTFVFVETFVPTATSPSNSPVQTAISGGQCGILAENTVCPEGECCSIFGYCGITADHCINNCASQCTQ